MVVKRLKPPVVDKRDLIEGHLSLYAGLLQRGL